MLSFYLYSHQLAENRHRGGRGYFQATLDRCGEETPARGAPQATLAVDEAHRNAYRAAPENIPCRPYAVTCNALDVIGGELLSVVSEKIKKWLPCSIDYYIIIVVLSMEAKVRECT